MKPTLLPCCAEMEVQLGLLPGLQLTVQFSCQLFLDGGYIWHHFHICLGGHHIGHVHPKAPHDHDQTTDNHLDPKVQILNGGEAHEVQMEGVQREGFLHTRGVVLGNRCATSHGGYGFLFFRTLHTSHSLGRWHTCSGCH